MLARIRRLASNSVRSPWFPAATARFYESADLWWVPPDGYGNGTIDLVLVSRQGTPNTLLSNNGAGVFTNVTSSQWTLAANTAREVEVGDVDQDGDLDVIVLRGDPNMMLPGQNSLYLNSSGVLTEYLDSGLGSRTGIVADGDLADYDGDGDLDLVLVRQGESVQVLQNTTLGAGGGAVCGDGVVNQASEQCDDGNTTPNDGCGATCFIECGDGVLQPGEVCDPGIDSNCNSSCSGYLACMDGSSCLSVWSVPEGAAADDQIQTRFEIRNNGTTTVPLSSIRVRYWFTSDGVTNLSYACYSTPGGCADVEDLFDSVGPVSGADTSLELSFTGGGGLAPGQAQGQVVGGIHGNPYAPLSELDDHSYVSGATLAPNSHFTLYVDGLLVWGEEPSGGAGSALWW